MAIGVNLVLMQVSCVCGFREFGHAARARFIFGAAGYACENNGMDEGQTDQDSRSSLMRERDGV
jgi:hypothetical protein